MNEFEENIYKDIKNELLTSVIDKKVDTYFANHNELTHYYNVGKMIVDAQGGEERAKYSDGLIRKYAKKLSCEIGKGYTFTASSRMRKFYSIFSKVATLSQLLTWSHYIELLSLDDVNEVNYYIGISIKNNYSVRKLRDTIKSKEYQRIDDKTKTKLINKEELDIYDNIKNPIYINTYNTNINKTNIEEKVLKSFILRDMDNFLRQLGDGFCYMASEYKIMN